MLTRGDVVGLYRKATTELPQDIRAKLEAAAAGEEGAAKEALRVILENTRMAMEERKPICQDTGTPVFYVKLLPGESQREALAVIEAATDEATKAKMLRPNALQPLTGKVMGNRPEVHFEESDEASVDLILKGGGSENTTRIYALPNTELGAGRDIGGVKKCVLDAVYRAQGGGCPPYIVSVAIGGSFEGAAALAKKQLLRSLDETPTPLEAELLKKINGLGIGPMGLGGATTAIGVKAGEIPHHPASFFVCVSFGCWALRRASL